MMEIETLDRSSTDAQHWAEQFCKTLKKINQAKGQPTEIDVDWVMGWFANYWAAVHDPLSKQNEILDGALTKCIKNRFAHEDVIKEIVKDARQAAKEVGDG